jgi:Amidohydrolase family
MRFLSLAVRVFVCLAALAASSCSRHPLEIAITHVTVVDTTGSPSLPDQTVLLSGEKISAIGPSSMFRIPHQAQVLDATGEFLIPGLVDMHLHLTGAGEPGGSHEFFLPLLLANGITTVRDMGGYLEALVPLRNDINRGDLLGPRIFFAGPYLDGSPPNFEPSLVVTNAVQASEDVNALLHRGVDFIKVQSSLSRDAYFAIAAVCRREHTTFVGHVPDRITAAEASDAGQRSIEHLTCVLRACSTAESRLMLDQFQGAPGHATASESRARQIAWDRLLLRTYSPRIASELLAKFASNHTWQVPTLVLLRHDAYPLPGADSFRDPLLQYVPGSVLKVWRRGMRDRDRSANAGVYAFRRAAWHKSLTLVGQMPAAGVHVMAGTDSAAPFVVPGFSLHQELALLVRAGFTPMQALQAATIEPARFLGTLNQQGTVASGTYADLVLLNANPLDDIRNVDRIHAVFVRGKLLDRSALDQYLDSAKKYASAH